MSAPVSSPNLAPMSASSVAPSAQLLETMRAEQGQVPLLGRHLTRLAASAEALGFAADGLAAAALAEQAGRVVREAARTLGPGLFRLRLLVSRDGRVLHTSEPLVAAPLHALALWPRPFTEAGTPRCLHKTTDRAHYEIPFAWARAAGADEVLLARADGRLVEGSRTSVWLRLGGRLCTPPAEVGGLPGVARAHLLATRPDAEERTLYADDLARAEAVYASNALYGLRRVGRVLTLPPEAPPAEAS